MNVIYCYPMWHTVSFTLVSKKHIQQLRRFHRVYEWDELSFPEIYPVEPYTLFVHPFFFASLRWMTEMKLLERGLDYAVGHVKARLSKFRKVVAVEVADSDRVGDLAVRLTEIPTDVVVPSEFSRRAMLDSGVKTPVHVVPHGLDPEWYLSQPQTPTATTPPHLRLLWEIKQRKGWRVLLFWMWHSPDRKGWAEVRQVYERLRGERDDVLLVVVTVTPLAVDPAVASRLGIYNIYGWLGDQDKMLLYDTADVTLLFSRGGAFELCGLESLSRGTPIVAHRMGSWAEYAPQWLLVKEGLRVRVLENNWIHVGYGYTVDVDSALDRIHELLEMGEESKARVKEHAVRELLPKYNWTAVGERLKGLIPEG